MVQFSWPSEKAPAEIRCTTDCLTSYRHANLSASQFDHHSLLHAYAILGYNMRICGGHSQLRGFPQLWRTEHLQDEVLLVLLTLWDNIIASPCLYEHWRTCFQWWISCTFAAAEVMEWRAKGWGLWGNWCELWGNEVWHFRFTAHSRNAKKSYFWRYFATEMYHTLSGVQRGKKKREWSNRWGCIKLYVKAVILSLN